MQESICELSKKYITDLFHDRIAAKLYFHNLGHTTTVVYAAELIGQGLGLKASEINLVKVAAWFHDAGMLKSAKDHETASADLAEKALQSWGVNTTEIEKVIGCIKATKLPQSPTSLLEEVICDADLYHLSQADYWHRNTQLKQEFVAMGICGNSNFDWLKNNARFLMSHEYFTPFAKSVLEPLKQQHIKENLIRLNQIVK